MKIPVSPDIVGLAPYVPGKPIAVLERELGIRGAIKLASNENPLGPSKAAVAAIRAGLRQIFRYPDGAGCDLVAALADRWKVPAAQVMIGNGSNEIIELLVRTFILPGDEVVMARPSFSLYRLMVTAGHGTPVEVPLADGRHDLPRMLKAITRKTRLVFICNPNNPTGTMVSEAEVARFLTRVPKRVLVVFDEAYAEYATAADFPQSIVRARSADNVIMLRTFSKLYGLAGLMIGYGIGPAPVIDLLSRVRQPFSTNILAQQAARAALSDDAHVTRSLAVNRTGMAYLTQAFDAMRIGYFPSQANFIYFRLDDLDPFAAMRPPSSNPFGRRVFEALLREGVIVRHFEGNALRVTVGLPRENRRFVLALQTAIEKAEPEWTPGQRPVSGGST